MLEFIEWIKSLFSRVLFAHFIVGGIKSERRRRHQMIQIITIILLLLIFEILSSVESQGSQILKTKLNYFFATFYFQMRKITFIILMI